MAAKVTIEFTGRIELDTQGWEEGCTVAQVKKQARDEINNWQIMLKKGTLDPKPVNFIRAKVIEVILPIE
jgi:hypothetical protein